MCLEFDGNLVLALGERFIDRIDPVIEVPRPVVLKALSSDFHAIYEYIENSVPIGLHHFLKS